MADVADPPRYIAKQAEAAADTGLMVETSLVEIMPMAEVAAEGMADVAEMAAQEAEVAEATVYVVLVDEAFIPAEVITGTR